MKSIKDILNRKNSSSRQNDFRSEVDNKTIIKISRDAVLFEVERLSPEDIREIFYEKKKLIVKTAHPAVASEIWRKKEKIVKKINELIGKESVKNLIIK